MNEDVRPEVGLGDLEVDIPTFEPPVDLVHGLLGYQEEGIQIWNTTACFDASKQKLQNKVYITITSHTKDSYTIIFILKYLTKKKISPA